MSGWVVVDLEATCWLPSDDAALSSNQAEHAEIIEIGAVRIDGATRTVVDEFSSFVRPVRHPSLSRFCTRLTGITQDQVDPADPFTVVVGRFRAWLGDEAATTMWSWGRYDHRQLSLELRRAGLEAPTWTHRDLKNDFGAFVRNHGGKSDRFGLARALTHLGWTFEGQAHRGIDDARNAARILQHIRDPSHRSPRAEKLLALMRTTEPCDVRIARKQDRKAREWFGAACKELIALGLAEDLGNGRGLQRTALGRATPGPQ